MSGYDSLSNGIFPYRHSYHSTAICVYCQGEAVLFDHVLPLSEFKKLPYPKLWHPSLFQLVPCCYSCNVRAGKRLFYSFEQKVLVISLEVLASNIRKYRSK